MSATVAPTTTGEPIQRRKFQLTDLTGNNNKFYLVEIWPQNGDNVLFRATWGRVGSRPQTSEKVTTMRWVERQIDEKLRKGYQEVALHRPTLVVADERANYTPIDTRIQSFVDLIYREANEKIASFLAVGLDALSAEQIDRGRKLLMLAQNQYAAWQSSQSQSNFQILAGTIQTFYNAVPTQLPARINRDQIVKDFCGAFDEQEERLNQLEAAIATMSVQQVKPDVSPYEALGAEIVPLEQNDPRFGELVDYLERTLVHGYKARVREIFGVAIPDERHAFERNTLGREHTELLFHGTAGQNVRHILRSGLICPRTASHGRMFGHGIYFANKSSKSINYCSMRSRHAPHVLFLANVAIGKPFVATDAMPDLREAPRGHASVLGKAGHTKAWGGSLQFDEFIVYSAAQQTLRYIVTFER